MKGAEKARMIASILLRSDLEARFEKIRAIIFQGIDE